ncbi:MAG: hypothetical protein OEY34_02580, partial [Cyclobacteriaceae bacterium]|nr:hypothetical protein [Cyclobacteriaceae bacterium]
MAQVIKKRLFKAIKIVFISLSALFILTAIAVQVPYVQSRIVNYISNVIRKNTDFNLVIENVSISWFDEADLKNIQLFDPDSNQMAFISEVTIDFNLSNLFSKTEIYIDEIEVDSANLFFTHVLSDTSKSLNITMFVYRLQDMQGSSGGKAIPIKVGSIKLNEAILGFHHAFREKMESGFDPNHFDFKINETIANDARIYLDTIQLNLVKFSGEETNTNSIIHSLTSDFLYSYQSMIFSQMDLLVGSTEIKEELKMYYDSPVDLSYFIDKVELEVNFNESKIFAKDIVKLFPEAAGFKGSYTLWGDFKGKVSNFS